MLVMYAIIGFGGQLPIGMLLDKFKTVKLFASLSLTLLFISILFYFINPEVAIIIAGLASAGIHVTGGTVCLQITENKVGPLAIFTAPGILGLTFGGLLGFISSSWLILVAVAILFICWRIFILPFPCYEASKKNKSSELDPHDWVMLTILLIMCFRSAIFDILNNYIMEFEYGGLLLGASAFAGKFIGGLIADKIGLKRFVYLTLPMAFMMLWLGNSNIYAVYFGIACLQSSVPVTLILMWRNLPYYPATATAFSLGTSVAFAGLPLYMLGHTVLKPANMVNWILYGFIAMMLLWVAVLSGKRLLKTIRAFLSLKSFSQTS